MIQKIETVLDQVEEWTLFAVVMIALVGLFLAVVLRYGFDYTLAGADELVRNVIIYTTFVGLSVAIRKDSMIRVDALVQMVPVLRRPLRFFSVGITLLFAILLIRYGLDLVEMMHRTGQSTITLGIPLWLIYGILPFSGVLMAIRSISCLVGMIFGHAPANGQEEAA